MRQDRELEQRLDGLRLVLSVLISTLPNRYEVVTRLQAAEAIARQQGMSSQALSEMADLRSRLEDL